MEDEALVDDLDKPYNMQSMSVALFEADLKTELLFLLLLLMVLLLLLEQLLLQHEHRLQEHPHFDFLQCASNDLQNLLHNEQQLHKLFCLRRN